MKVLVYPHDLGMGGSQTNAIELAAAVRQFGVECTVFGRPGTLNARIAEQRAAAQADADAVRAAARDQIHAAVSDVAGRAGELATGRKPAADVVDRVVSEVMAR